MLKRKLSIQLCFYFVLLHVSQETLNIRIKWLTCNIPILFVVYTAKTTGSSYVTETKRYPPPIHFFLNA